ncbi:TonB-dependent receptor domain-containing protein [Paucibacter sp. XJ19-41]|uniref:TonB-dependent receptor domain-containing protein n=1 Tax=Paucibacter sp. XJ19-41 TaxID=2927824 RepID=UPI00234B0EE8|nr:TonB-dependent receptor [Paucibacter sp. XJ19-41]MDC6170537.1 TonB-dependent receptor [Paucibacter sp. XJ19-41]
MSWVKTQRLQGVQMFRKSKISAAALLALSGGVALTSAPAFAQEKLERIEITGSRLKKVDLEASSPTVTVTAAEIQANQDVTLETFLNTLPQINPAGTTSSNNPGNGGQANINLRGLGPNRNLILIDGRRPMVSASDQTVDLNTIPMAMIDSIEIISGGAAAVYGADAVAGVVNIKLKRRFQGFDLRAGTSKTTKQGDALERNVQGLIGGNFADNKGNAVLGFEYAQRDALYKKQRPFSALATGTTGAWPEGRYVPSGTNLPSQAAVNAIYAGYGYTGAQIPRGSAHSFNTDGTLIYPGVFNSPLDVVNWKYPIDAGVNTRFFPDFYSYNFDPENLLVLPLDRRAITAKADYQLDSGVEVFGRFSNTRYNATTALAPTPVSGGAWRAPGQTTAPTQIVSSFIVPGQRGSALLVNPNNVFIPADLKTLLNSRTGDDPTVVGTGANEAFGVGWRTVAAGLRSSTYENEVTQYLAGAKGDIFSTGWTWEGSLSEGRTKIDQSQQGNINAQKLADALGAVDGGQSLCAGGVNPFGRQTLSAECAAWLQLPTSLKQEYKQTIAQFFVAGDVVKLPAGMVGAVLGYESRRFKYELDPGSTSSPIYGFNSQSPAKAKNSFDDFFAELSVPLAKNMPMIQSANLSLAYRNSASKATDVLNGVETPKKRSNAFAANLDWQPTRELRARASAQRSVRAPNFGELFDGGGSFPSIFDPCSINSVGRTTGANAAQLGALCTATGVANTSFVATPGGQAETNTTGNINLKPETSNSVTLGLVWTPGSGGFLGGFRGSVDYYNIKVKDAITDPDVNEFIADCYNYNGRNPTYSATSSSCAKLVRAGSSISGAYEPGQEPFAGSNEGQVQTSGIDFSLGWGGRVGPGRLDVQGFWTHLLEYKSKSTSLLPAVDYAGTVAYFGVTLGQTFPKNKVTIASNYKWGDVGIDLRMRYIGGMTNRMAKLFPGEDLTGVPATVYWDLGGSYDFTKSITVRAGINNLLDQKARLYSPNVQSGTDPSTYDVVGRRYFVTANFSFK